jgi:hypothetical protein
MRLAAMELVNKVKILPVFIFATDRKKAEEIPLVCAVGLKVKYILKELALYSARHHFSMSFLKYCPH